MKKLKFIRYCLLSLALITVTVFSIWFFAVPDNIIKDYIEDSASQYKFNANVKGLRKGFFFTLYAENLDLKKDPDSEILKITDISGKINPLYLFKKQLAFSVKGKIGTGDIYGSFNLPENGNIEITNAEIAAIPYITSIGLKGNGIISGSIIFKNNNTDVTFTVPDADIDGSILGMPLPLTLFHKIQGAFSIKGNTIEVVSITLEGEKLYARLSGNAAIGGKKPPEITGLTLEVMPAAEYVSTNEFKSLESAILKKYEASPGYYVIRIEN
ncbi:MAG: type II secretion system protein GspN [Nitrospirae bacterium]|nr:type II secretion system protein GspN [Nitrospirota bacterium]